MTDYGLKPFSPKNLVMCFSLPGSVSYDPHVWVCAILIELVSVLFL